LTGKQLSEQMVLVNDEETEKVVQEATIVNTDLIAASRLPEAAPGKITLMFVGDIMLSRAVGDLMAVKVVKSDWGLVVSRDSRLYQSGTN